ncbi:MAG: BrnT family toxin [Candidatus Puniceispirillales bacterium]
MYIKCVIYEWDKNKQKQTLIDRGVNFADVVRLNWDLALTREDKRQDYQENRYVTIAPIDDRLHIVVWCKRRENIRIISLRKANQREEKFYDEKILHR